MARDFDNGESATPRTRRHLGAAIPKPVVAFSSAGAPGRTQKGGECGGSLVTACRRRWTGGGLSAMLQLPVDALSRMSHERVLRGSPHEEARCLYKCFCDCGGVASEHLKRHHECPLIISNNSNTQKAGEGSCKNMNTIIDYESMAEGRPGRATRGCRQRVLLNFPTASLAESGFAL